MTGFLTVWQSPQNSKNLKQWRKVDNQWFVYTNFLLWKWTFNVLFITYKLQLLDKTFILYILLYFRNIDNMFCWVNCQSWTATNGVGHWCFMWKWSKLRSYLCVFGKIRPAMWFTKFRFFGTTRNARKFGGR